MDRPSHWVDRTSRGILLLAQQVSSCLVASLQNTDRNFRSFSARLECRSIDHSTARNLILFHRLYLVRYSIEDNNTVILKTQNTTCWGYLSQSQWWKLPSSMHCCSHFLFYPQPMLVCMLRVHSQFAIPPQLAESTLVANRRYWSFLPQLRYSEPTNLEP